jgi:hypothetical protein
MEYAKTRKTAKHVYGHQNSRNYFTNVYNLDLQISRTQSNLHTNRRVMDIRKFKCTWIQDYFKQFWQASAFNYTIILFIILWLYPYIKVTLKFNGEFFLSYLYPLPHFFFSFIPLVFFPLLSYIFISLCYFNAYVKHRPICSNSESGQMVAALVK